MRKDSAATMALLHLISSHLSSRKECRHIEYVVRIQGSTVFMDPYVEVLPSRYKRKPQLKTSVVEHILKYHLPDVSELVSGTYVYQLSTTGTRRKWTSR